jgi:hypothetical protein
MRLHGHESSHPNIGLQERQRAVTRRRMKGSSLVYLRGFCIPGLQRQVTIRFRPADDNLFSANDPGMSQELALLVFPDANFDA